MPPHKLVLAAALMTILLTPGAADAGKRGASGGGARQGPISPSLWLVELGSPPAVEGTDAAILEREHRDFERAAARAGLGYRRRGEFRILFNGFSVAIDPRDLGTLARIPGVRLYPAEPVPPALANAVSMTGVDEVHASLGFTGAGIKIGIIDSGIDYDHPDLGGCFGPGCKVAYGYDFVGDAYDASGNGEPVPDDDPDDCGGHGTHVAGIAAADGEIVGVAPGATLGAYRVFGCSGTTSDDVIIAALERALADGMDVVNLSLGAPFGWAKGPVGLAASRLVNAGVVVVAAQGNDGASGLYSTGTVAAGEKVIGVGSVENAVLPFSGIEVAGQAISVNNNQTGPPLPASGSETIVVVGGDPCNNVFGKDPAGKVALTPFPGAACDTGVVVSNLSNAGASGILLYWPTADIVVSFNIPWLTIPAGSIRKSSAEFIAAQADPVAMTWLGAIANPATGRMASSSSWGLEPELHLKPNLSAPGVGIVSTYPLEKGGHATLSGTSMASPHVAGAAALLLEAYPKTPAQAVRGVLQASAVPVAKPPLDPPLAGLEWPLAQQGAGLLQIDAAIGAGARIEPAELSLGEGACGETTSATLRVESRSPDDRIYDLSATSTLATTGVVSVGLAASDESVAFSVGGTPTTTLALPAGGTVEVEVTFTRDCATEGSDGIYGGWIVLDEPVFEEELVVPYVGFAGDYQAIEVWPAGWEPQLRGGGASFGCAFTTVFDLSTCKPVFVVHLRHEVRRLRFEVESVSGRAWHRAFPDFEYMPRNRDAAPNSLSNYYGFWWDGITSHGKKQTELPDGDYVVRISVLKALGDDANPDDWQTAVVGPFTIDRP